jgi:hypothetical protein
MHLGQLKRGAEPAIAPQFQAIAHPSNPRLIQSTARALGDGLLSILWQSEKGQALDLRSLTQLRHDSRPFCDQGSFTTDIPVAVAERRVPLAPESVDLNNTRGADPPMQSIGWKGHQHGSQFPTEVIMSQRAGRL